MHHAQCTMHSGAAQPSILPLPDHVVAQIKSSTAIVSLNHVVLELLKNSLDAKAASVDLVVDFTRGACTAEDDGQGISPLEFRENGGLGKLYCTSKYHVQDSSLGRHGTFLASLAAMSLMIISSHHHQHRSTNAITFHHSKAIQRELPASAHNLVHTKHGTRVVVRNLFGNLPVRVKHRSIALDQKTEYDRLWAALKRDMTALLLSWRGTASIRVRDASNKSIFNFNTSQTVIEWGSRSRNAPKPRPAQLTSMLNILTQAAYISIEEWASWVPASASTSSISVKGAISLLAAPSKNVQFISLGIRPLLAESEHNELFDQANRLFALSSFGTTEDDDDVDEVEATRRKSDKRYKGPEYTNRQLKGRKDVDRHPMFCLRITLKDSQNEKTSEDQLLESETSLQAVLEVMSAMIRQWLSVHHFRPRLPRKKSARSVASSTSMSEKGEMSDAAPPPANQPPHDSRNLQVPRLTSTSTASTKTKRSTKTIPQESSQKVQRTAFAEWSRIKSGKADFFSNLTAMPKHVATATSSNDEATVITPSTPTENFRGFEVEPIKQGAFSFATSHENTSKAAVDSLDKNNEGDEAICWVDPTTKKSFMLNARTGSVMANAQPRRRSEPTVPIFSNTLNGWNKSLRLTPKSAGAIPSKNSWLDEVLQTWDNPVFKPSEPPIQRAFSKGQKMENNYSASQYSHSHLNTEQDFSEVSASSSSKLSKEGLRNAQVIAQVNKKFILAKIPNAVSLGPSEHPSTELLVLIDQHAADERVQVEQLWKDFCQPASTSSTQTSYQSNLGQKSHILSTPLEKKIQFSVSAQEQTHFTTHAPRFAAWGILYDTCTANNHSSTSAPASHASVHQTTNQKTLSVTSLPPLILTRCTTDPKLLISTLRSIVWYFESNDSLPPLLNSSSYSSPSANNPSTLPSPPPDQPTKTTPWLHKMSNSPPALTELINSRACRSAIMFNDPLTYEECTGLVERLSGCVFPFMCAHGRPSMVPLGDLGSVGGVEAGSGLGGDGAEEGSESFVGAWKAWKSRARDK